MEPAAVQPLEKRTKNQSLKAQNEVIMAFLWLQNWFSVAAASFTSWFGSWSWGREKRLRWPDYTFLLIFKFFFKENKYIKFWWRQKFIRKCRLFLYRIFVQIFVSICIFFKRMDFKHAYFDAFKTRSGARTIIDVAEDAKYHTWTFLIQIECFIGRDRCFY